MNKDRKILSLERKNAEKQQMINDHERYIYSIDRKLTNFSHMRKREIMRRRYTK